MLKEGDLVIYTGRRGKYQSMLGRILRDTSRGGDGPGGWFVKFNNGEGGVFSPDRLAPAPAVDQLAELVDET